MLKRATSSQEILAYHIDQRYCKLEDNSGFA